MTAQDIIDALVLVDLQNCFMPGGELSVAKGDEVVQVANRMIPEFDRVYASRDQHPEGHCSFASSHGVEPFGYAVFPDGVKRQVWPIHGVIDTQGAAWHPDLRLPESAIIIDKGMGLNVDSPSAFWDVTKKVQTELEPKLRADGVNTLYIMGLATDVCLLLTVLDALAAGFTVYVIIDGCRGVNPGDCERAIETMKRAGAKILTSEEV